MDTKNSSALENAGLNEAYTFSTSGIFVFVIILSVAAMMFGNKIQKRHDSNASEPEKIEEPPADDIWLATSGGIWQQEIESLEDDILLERYHNEYEWSSGYRKLCYEELQKRNISASDIKQENEKWICPECVRENDNTIKTCKCGYQKIDSI